MHLPFLFRGLSNVWKTTWIGKGIKHYWQTIICASSTILHSKCDTLPGKTWSIISRTVHSVVSELWNKYLLWQFCIRTLEYSVHHVKNKVHLTKQSKKRLSIQVFMYKWKNYASLCYVWHGLFCIFG